MQQLLPGIFGRKSINLFIQMAETVTAEYVEQITNDIIISGIQPSFEELMDMVQSLTNDLTLKVSWLRDNYKLERGRQSARLTRSCKKIITKSTNDFIRTVRLIEQQKHIHKHNSPQLSY